MDIVLLYPIYLFISIANGAVQSLHCTDGFQLNGTFVTLQCRVDSAFLRWTVPPNNVNFDFAAVDKIGSTQSEDGFIAVLNTNGTSPASSSLTFMLNPSLNGTSVTCFDAFQVGSSSCQLLVIGESGRIPYEVLKYLYCRTS